MQKSMQKSMPKKLRKILKIDRKIGPKWTENRCPNRSERKNVIFRKVLFFLRKTILFEDPRVQNPIKNRSKIASKFKLEKVMLNDAKIDENWFKIDLKSRQKSIKKRCENSIEKRSQKIWKIGGTNGPKSKISETSNQKIIRSGGLA